LVSSMEKANSTFTGRAKRTIISLKAIWLWSYPANPNNLMNCNDVRYNRSSLSNDAPTLSAASTSFQLELGASKRSQMRRSISLVMKSCKC
jgi:hypothetical protein